MSGHLSIMRNPALTAAVASQGMRVSVTKYYDLDAEILGRFIYHTHGVGGHIQMASKISESFFSLLCIQVLSFLPQAGSETPGGYSFLWFYSIYMSSLGRNLKME